MPPAMDRTTRAQLRGVRIGMVAYAIFLLALAVSVQRGWAGVGWAGFLVLALLTVAASAGFHVAIRSGWSRRFADPGLTMLQIGTSAALVIAMVRVAGEARGVMLMLSFIGMLFGLFVLNTRQLLLLAAGIAGGYALVVLVPVLRAAHGDVDRQVLELLRFIVLSMVLSWVAFVGGHVGRLRRRLLEALERLRTLASHDELTSVYNRRHLMEILAREKERADRYHVRFSVCILDLDHFKSFNDRFGHEAGDDALRAFAQRLRGRSRAMDWLAREEERLPQGTFGRYGGEEFLLVLPHADQAGAVRCVERIRASLAEQHTATSDGPVAITFSAGIAQYQAGEDVGTLLRRADAALYRAKARGRDRIEVADPPAEAEGASPEA